MSQSHPIEICQDCAFALNHGEPINVPPHKGIPGFIVVTGEEFYLSNQECDLCGDTLLGNRVAAEELEV